MDREFPVSEIAARMGERIRARRLEMQLRLEDLASFIRTSESDVQAIEAGQKTLTARQLYELCPLLEVTPSWFFDGLS